MKKLYLLALISVFPASFVNADDSLRSVSFENINGAVVPAVAAPAYGGPADDKMFCLASIDGASCADGAYALYPLSACGNGRTCKMSDCTCGVGPDPASASGTIEKAGYKKGRKKPNCGSGELTRNGHGACVSKPGCYWAGNPVYGGRCVPLGYPIAEASDDEGGIKTAAYEGDKETFGTGRCYHTSDCMGPTYNGEWSYDTCPGRSWKSDMDGRCYKLRNAIHGAEYQDDGIGVEKVSYSGKGAGKQPDCGSGRIVSSAVNAAVCNAKPGCFWSGNAVYGQCLAGRAFGPECPGDTGRRSADDMTCAEYER